MLCVFHHLPGIEVFEVSAGTVTCDRDFYWLCEDIAKWAMPTPPTTSLLLG